MFSVLIAKGLLPPSNTKRWIGKRKALVVEAVVTGMIALGDACRFYNLTIEEFLGWREETREHASGIRRRRFERDGEDSGRQEREPSSPRLQERPESRHRGHDAPLC